MVDTASFRKMPADLVPAVIVEILLEQQRAFRKYGGPISDESRAASDWERVITRFATTSAKPFRARMVRIAGLAISAIEAHDRLEAQGEAVDLTPAG